MGLIALVALLSNHWPWWFLFLGIYGSTTVDFCVGCCSYCPDAPSVDIVFAGIANPCLTDCTEAPPGKGFWWKGTSHSINGGHSLTGGSGFWFHAVALGFEYSEYFEEGCDGESVDGLSADVPITVLCSDTPDANGKHLRLVVDVFTLGGTGYVLYSLYDLRLNFDEEVNLPGLCGGTVIISRP